MDDPNGDAHRHLRRLTLDSPSVVTLNVRKSTLIVYLRLEWPIYIVDRLPDDFTLTLSGPDVPAQKRTKADGSQEDDLVRFEFEWKDKSRAIQLTASGDGKTVELWLEQVAGDLAAKIDWNERIHPLLAESEDVEVAMNDADAGETPADLRYAELPDLTRALA